MKIMCRAFFLVLFLTGGFFLKGQEFPFEIIHYSGSPDGVFNLVIMGDGYLASDEGKLVNDAKNATNVLLSQEPWKSYSKSINVYLMKVVSNESGAATSPDKLIDNYFGSSFNSYGIERLLVAWRPARVSIALAINAPFFDIGMIVVNDSRYGGSGGAYPVFSTHTSAAEIFMHELGHSFVGLSDEYWAGDQYARESANMTSHTVPETIKWRNFLNRNGVGIFPHEESPTWQRPHQSCKMRFLGRSFCDVCSHELTNRLALLANPGTPERPIANFGADRLTINESEKVRFFDFSTQDPTAWEWEFEGGTPERSNTKNPEITYDNPGSFKVTLVSKNNLGQNTITKTKYIKVLGVEEDKVPPVISVKNVDLLLDKYGKGNVSAEDVDDGTTDDTALAEISLSRTDFTCSDLGANNVIFTARDSSGNESTAEVIVTVLDRINPVARARNMEIILGEDDSYVELDPESVDNGSTDNCGIKKRTLSKTQFGRVDAGENLVTYKVWDGSGNSCEVEIIVNVDIIMSAQRAAEAGVVPKLYPNPGNGAIYLSYPNTIDPDLFSIQILDTHGRILRELNTIDKSNKTLMLDVSNLVPGSYFLRLNSVKNIRVLRFSVRR